jgi:aspartate/methionine/tyrosine aminotransferase
MEVPNYMQVPGVARSLGAAVQMFRLRQDHDWEPDWDEFDRAVTPRTRLLYLSNPNNPTGSILSREAMAKIVSRCESTGTWIVADEVYLGAEIDGDRTPSFWGTSDRVIVTSGLSKAYGIPGIRVGWIVAAPAVVAGCWAQHDYLTIGPNKLSDRLARIAVEPHNRERCYARTRAILQHNLPIAHDWIAQFGGRVTWRAPKAGAIALVHYEGSLPSIAIADRVRVNQSTLIVPGSHVGLEGYLRIWLGGREDYLREGLRRVATELAPAMATA